MNLFPIHQHHMGHGNLCYCDSLKSVCFDLALDIPNFYLGIPPLFIIDNGLEQYEKGLFFDRNSKFHFNMQCQEKKKGLGNFVKDSCIGTFPIEKTWDELVPNPSAPHRTW
jgi:hypothetical protein